MKSYKIISEKELPESELEIELEIDQATVSQHRSQAIKRLGATASIPGFRPGHIPENILIQKVGEMHVLEEASYSAIEEVLPEILLEKKLAVVGEPQVSITKIANASPLGFKIVVSLLPEVKLPDYKKIASVEISKKPEDTSVSEKELNDFIENLRKSFAKSVTPNTSADSKDKQELPEINDEFVQKLGAFKDVTDFKNKIRENLAHEKEHKAKEKKRIAIAEGILEKTNVKVPKALIESELTKMLSRFHDDVTRMGAKLEEYLKEIKKTEEDLRKDWRKDAEKHAKLQLILTTIAGEEKIGAKNEDVEHEVKHLLEEYKEVDPKRAKAYVTMMLTNEKVFEFLESQK